MTHLWRIFVWFALYLSAASYTMSLGAAEWMPNGTFREGLKGWKKYQKDESARVTLTLIEEGDERVARLTVAPETPTVASIDYELLLPVQHGILCAIKATYRTIDVAGGAAKLVVIFSGGKAAGNWKWFTTEEVRGTTPWREESLARTIPPDAKRMKLRLLLADGSGQILLKSVSVKPLEVSDLKSQPVWVRVRPDHPLNTISPLHFAVNAVYHFPGIYEGTLPESNPRSKRQQFVEALNMAGIRAIRFPGGMACHRYLAEGGELTKKLAKLLKRVSGNYEVDWPRGHYPQWEDVRDTMKQAGIKIIYSLNTSFFVDKDGEIRPVNDSKFTKKARLADGKDHSTEAANALDQLFQKGVFKVGDVDYWEIGNEEFALMSAEQYANIAAAYTRVLAKRDPGRPICYTGGPWSTNLEDLLAKHDVLRYLTGVTSHYPFGRWPGPTPDIATADYEAFARSDVDFKKNLDHFTAALSSGHIPAHLRKSVSETSIYKYFTYDPFRMTCSFAHALAFARNWPELISHPAVDMAVYHSLESTFFGCVMYHVEFDQLGRRFDWLGPNVRGGPDKGPPAKGKDKRTPLLFKRRYVLMPTARVMAMLSRFEGAKVVEVKSDPKNQLAGLLAGRAQGRSLFFVSNPQHEPVRVNFFWPRAWPRPTSGTWRMIEADSVYPVLDSEYRYRMLDAPLPNDNGFEVILPPLSVQVFEWIDR